MNIMKYFDLGLIPEEAVLGSKSKAEKNRSKLQRFLITMLMYIFLWLGILGQRYFAVQQAKLPMSWVNFGREFPIVAFFLATALFPLVFPKSFARMSSKAKKADGVWFFVQLCVAFQNGFFWQSLLSLIAPK